MPLVKINMLKGKSLEYKKRVLDSVHNGLVSSLGIEDWVYSIRVIMLLASRRLPFGQEFGLA